MTGLQKEITKGKNKNKGNRKPSGFAKPSKVTNELCEFMNKKEGTEIDEKWSKKYKDSIDCTNPKGFSQKAHCAARKKRQSGGITKSKSPFKK